jgi:guanylate kinase
MKKASPMLITVTGPSGTGKDAVIAALIEQDPQVKRFATATTREPRPGEVDKVSYYFMDKAQFDAAEAAGEFLETEKNNWSGHAYGTLHSVVDGYFADGFDVISDLTYSGVEQIYKKIPERHFRVLMLPPSRERLEQRLTGRNPALADEGRRRFTEMGEDLDHLHDPKWTFRHSRDVRGSSYADYDVVLINDVLDHTVAELAKIILKEREARVTG